MKLATAQTTTNLIKSIYLTLIVLVINRPELIESQLVIQPFDSGGGGGGGGGHNTIYFNNKIVKSRNDQINRPVLFRNRSASLDTTTNTMNYVKLVNSIMEIFKLSRNDIRWFEAHFNLKSIELLYPKSVSVARQLKRCVLGVKFRVNPARSAAIKLEFDQQVRARFDERTRMVVCNHPMRPAQNGMPTEK